MSKHFAYDLKQMQSLPLEAKIAMTQKRIELWYESWKRYEIYNKNTGKTRFVTATDEPPTKEHEYIDAAYDGQVYVSFSGGKDSTVLKHIVDSMYTDVPSVFVNTGLEYPELQHFVFDIKAGKYNGFSSNVEILRPDMRFDEVLRRYGYPVISKEVSRVIGDAQRGVPNGVAALDARKVDGTYSKYRERYVKYKHLVNQPFRISAQCCTVMKKNPVITYEKETGRLPILATMAHESSLRRKVWLKNGCNAFEAKRPMSQPMSFWTDQDVLEYIVRFGVPYAPVYGEIVKKGEALETTNERRTGCVFCMYGCHFDGSPNRFQRMKETHPRQYDYCINGGEMVDGKWQPSKDGLGLGFVLDHLDVPYK